MRKRYEKFTMTSNVIVPMVTNKRGTQLFSRLTMGGGLFCRDDPVGFGPEKGTG